MLIDDFVDFGFVDVDVFFDYWKVGNFEFLVCYVFELGFGYDGVIVIILLVLFN